MKELDYTNAAWKKAQVDLCFKTGLLFLGVIFMQMLAYLVCALGYSGLLIMQGYSQGKILQLLGKDFQSQDSVRIWISVVAAILSLVWCGNLYRKSSWREEKFSYKSALSFKNVGAILGIGVGGCIVFTSLISLGASFFPSAFHSYFNVMKNFSVKGSFVMVLYIVILGPISEEFIFRGAILDRMKLAFPFWVGNIVQAGLFGLYHMNLIQGLYAFVLGLILGMVGNKTKTIWSAILVHITFNTTSLLLGFLPQGKQGLVTPYFILVLILGIVLFFSSLLYFFHKGKIQLDK